MRPGFIHISKNAGSSVVRSASKFVDNCGHRTAASWVDEHGRSVPLFAIVRNPYDRVVSEYSYRRGRFNGGEQNPHLSNLHKPFDQWVLSTYQGDEYRTKEFFDRTGEPYNDYHMVDGKLIWFIAQTRWLSDANGDLLVDDVLRFETLTSDWRDFSTRHGFAAELAHVNASVWPADIADRFTPHVREVIFEYYRDDFDAFDYPRYL